MWWVGREARQRPAKPYTRVRIPYPPRAIGAGVARFLHTEEVTGSIPVSPTIQAGSLRSGSLCMRCPGYCGDCLRSDWRFGMGQRQYSMELRERASSTPRQTPNLSTSPFSSNNARATAPVTGRDTRYGALHPLWAAAPDQKGCTAYGSGAAHPITRTNAESARRRPTQQREGHCPCYGARHPL